MNKSFSILLKLKLQVRQSLLKNASPITKFISTRFLTITVKKKSPSISLALEKFLTFNSSQLREIGKIQKKNPTLTIVILGFKKMRKQKNVFSLRKDMLSKIMIQFVLLELIKLDKMMKLIKNCSLK